MITINMRITFVLTLLIAFTWACQSQNKSAQHNHDTQSTAAVQQDTLKKSVPKEEHAQVGAAHLMIKYHAPAVRGRTIWGGLVPYGDVWVTGAHSATSFEIDKDFVVGEKKIAAGKYALFTIPGKDKWTIILSKNWDQHLTDEYDQKDDVVRVDVVPEILENIQERLKYTITGQDETSAVLSIRWEKIRVSIPVTVK